MDEVIGDFNPVEECDWFLLRFPKAFFNGVKSLIEKA
jgi:hypothetical protein